MSLLSNEDLDRLALEIPHVKAWLAAVEKEIEAALNAGAEFVNVKLVPKRATRKWIEGLDIVKILRKFSRLDVVAPRVVLTPAGMEKVVGKKVFADKLADHTVKESSGLKLEYSGSESTESNEGN